MSASLFISQPGHPEPRFRPRSVGSAAGAPVDSNLPKEFATVREMLAALETLTIAGRRHDMMKVARFIQEYAARSFREHSARNRKSVALLLEDLSGEAERLIPDTETFQNRAEDLLVLLAPASAPDSIECGVSRAPAFGSVGALTAGVLTD